MHVTVYDVILSHSSHQHVSFVIAAIVRVRLLQEFRGTMWLVVLSLLNS